MERGSTGSPPAAATSSRRSARGGQFLVLDLAGVPFCDSAGLNVLIGAWRQADAVGAVLMLACVPKPLRRILEMTGADQCLRVCDTVADAEAAFGC
ncbi:STAS domain-containing protein [Streptomyces sp. NPDC017940]|uniref:STAS domain-containing protein n=1 Tax=Streptomyces sp. NPDC017940 TaxID=3365017 RepID=UPI0037AD7938